MAVLLVFIFIDKMFGQCSMSRKRSFIFGEVVRKTSKNVPSQTCGQVIKTSILIENVLDTILDNILMDFV